ncbi:MAG TPA: oxidative damage protection protein [Terriglobales bacterium]|jgi:Fe-S cluster biosynthesis and repair protein YggX
MAHTVYCVKLGKELPGLEEAPWPGELGQKIYDNVSVEAWAMWKEHAKMLMNEYRLAPWTPEAAKLINEQLELFFFGPNAGQGAQTPPGFVAVKPPQ